jgi:hypothetical protein
MVGKVVKEEKRKEKDDERKKKKAARKFMDLLESSKTITSFSKWEEVRESLATHSAFTALEEEERVKIFQEFVSRRKVHFFTHLYC